MLLRATAAQLRAAGRRVAERQVVCHRRGCLRRSLWQVVRQLARGGVGVRLRRLCTQRCAAVQAGQRAGGVACGRGVAPAGLVREAHLQGSKGPLQDIARVAGCCRNGSLAPNDLGKRFRGGGSGRKGRNVARRGRAQCAALACRQPVPLRPVPWPVSCMRLN